MKSLRSQPNFHHCHIRGQSSIERSLQIGQTVAPFRFKDDDLSPGMDSAIRPPSADHTLLRSRYGQQCSLEFALNGPLISLDLKPVKVATIVLDLGPEPALPI
jgi:hypothetical protein